MAIGTFGVVLPFAVPGRELQGFCRMVEESDIGALWVNDSGRGPDAFALLGAAAALTERVVLGTAVLLLPLRYPVLVARSALAIDRMSNGRLILGVGVGGERQADFEASGTRSEERGARTDEALAIISALWSGEPVSHAGRYYRFSDVQLQARPVQPRLPIWIGGRMGGAGKYRDAALRRAAKLGDGWFPYQMTVDQFAAGVSRLRNYCNDIGRTTPPATALLQFICIDDDAVRARETAIRVQSHGYGIDFSQLVDRYVITGTPKMCADRIAEYLAAGVSHLVFNWACDPVEVPQMVRRLIEQVLPLLPRPQQLA